MDRYVKGLPPGLPPFPRARRAILAFAAWSRDEDGMEIVEHLLLLSGIVLPLAYILMFVAGAMVRYYELTTWIISLPFP